MRKLLIFAFLTTLCGQSFPMVEDNNSKNDIDTTKLTKESTKIPMFDVFKNLGAVCKREKKKIIATEAPGTKKRQNRAEKFFILTNKYFSDKYSISPNAIIEWLKNPLSNKQLQVGAKIRVTTLALLRNYLAIEKNQDDKTIFLWGTFHEKLDQIPLQLKLELLNFGECLMAPKRFLMQIAWSINRNMDLDKTLYEKHQKAIKSCTFKSRQLIWKDSGTINKEDFEKMQHQTLDCIIPSNKKIKYRDYIISIKNSSSPNANKRKIKIKKGTKILFNHECDTDDVIIYNNSFACISDFDKFYINFKAGFFYYQHIHKHKSCLTYISPETLDKFTFQPLDYVTNIKFDENCNAGIEESHHTLLMDKRGEKYRLFSCKRRNYVSLDEWLQHGQKKSNFTGKIFNPPLFTNDTMGMLIVFPVKILPIIIFGTSIYLVTKKSLNMTSLSKNSKMLISLGSACLSGAATFPISFKHSLDRPIIQLLAKFFEYDVPLWYH